MRGLFRCVPVIGALVVLSACATTPEIPYDHTADNIHTIGLPTPGFPDGASVVLASDMGQSFGLIGALVDASMQSNRDSTFKDIVTKQNFTASDQFSQDLTAALTKDGYTVVPIAVARKDSGLLKELPAAPRPVDAYLDVAVVNYGYVAAGIGDNTPYRPFLMLQCKLIRASDKTVLMQDKIDLNPVFPSRDKEVTLSPEPQYQFTDFDTLTSKPKDATDGLRDSLAQVTDSLGTLLQ